MPCACPLGTHFLLGLGASLNLVSFDTPSFLISCLFTAKRILERRGIQTTSSFVKIWLVCIPKFKANFLFYWHLYGLDFLSRIYWSLLDHDLMASIWEKAISILAGNLNSRRSYLITAVSIIFLAFIWLGFLSRIYWSFLDHELMTSIWEKAISILAGNLNSRRSYLITAVLFGAKTSNFIGKKTRQINNNGSLEFSSLSYSKYNEKLGNHKRNTFRYLGFFAKGRCIYRG